jgi:VWFA-related protein
MAVTRVTPGHIIVLAMMSRNVLLGILICLLFAGTARAQTPSKGAAKPPADQAEQTITLDVTRVNILFTVSDRKGRFVNNLVKDDFEIVERKKKQNILDFTAEQDLLLRIGVLIDTSNSIRERFRFELEAASEFLNGLIRKGKDKAIVVAFDTQPELIADFTDDHEELSKKLRGLRPGGGTALYDAMAFACRDRLSIDQPMNKFSRAIVLIGDGDDNASRYTRDQALEFCQKAGVVIFAISTNITKVETDGDKVLRYYAEQTGGQAFFPFKAQDMAQDFENIAHVLRSQYSVLYRPEPLVTDGLFHPIDVKVKGRKDLVVRARKGYYAPKM